MTTILEVKNISKKFPLQRRSSFIHAVDAVSFSQQTEEVIGIVGESGCGKSTLARLILRLIEPSTGSVQFAGKDLNKLSPSELRQERKQMQMIFQDPLASLDPRLSIETTLAEPLLIHNVGNKNERRQRVSELLDIVGLPKDAAKRYPHEFSGGQRQRINIARAIALHPKLIVADEPVSALDVSIQSQILNLLDELKIELGLSYLFISHDLAVIKHISDRVAVMYLGKIVEFTDTETLYTDAAHPYTQALISAIPQPDPSRKRQRIVLHGETPSPEHPPSGCPFHPRCPQAIDICKTIAPHEKNIGKENKQHLVSCHLH